jgi:hypothetical protein
VFQKPESASTESDGGYAASNGYDDKRQRERCVKCARSTRSLPRHTCQVANPFLMLLHDVRFHDGFVHSLLLVISDAIGVVFQETRTSRGSMGVPHVPITPPKNPNRTP